MVKEFLMEEEALTSIEIVLIIVVLVSLVMIFKNQLLQILGSAFGKVRDKAGKL